MLLEKKVFHLQEVGDLSLDEIKGICFRHFGNDLEDAIEKENEDEVRGIINYNKFSDQYGCDIKLNSKNIVFENTTYSKDVQAFCSAYFGLHYVRGTETFSPYYTYEDEEAEATATNKCHKLQESETVKEKKRTFNEFFGKGEFPNVTICIFRVGNKDHFFYTICR